MKITTSNINPPVPSRDYDWSAIDSDTYDGAKDSSNRHQVGYGRTEREAIANLMEILADAEDCDPDCWCCQQEATAHTSFSGKPCP